MKGSGGRRRHFGSAEHPEHPCAGSESQGWDGAGTELPSGAGAGAGGAGTGELSGAGAGVYRCYGALLGGGERAGRGRAAAASPTLLPCPSFHPRVSGWICCWRCLCCPSPDLHCPEPCRVSPASLRKLSRGTRTAFLPSLHAVSVSPPGAVLRLPFFPAEQVRKPKLAMN